MVACAVLLATSACGDDDDNTTADDLATRAATVVQGAATTAATNVQGAATTAATNVQGAATKIATSAQGVGTAVAGSVTARSETTVNATLADFSIKLDPDSASSGKVEFQIKNTATQTHEFVVFKTDLAEDKLPMASSGSEVDEEGAGVEAIDEKEDIAGGETDELNIDDLAAGKYVIICNVPAHYAAGMHTSFTVK